MSDYCPFCHAENAQVVQTHHAPPRNMAVRCMHCGAQGPAKATSSEALVAWSRVEPAPDQTPF